MTESTVWLTTFTHLLSLRFGGTGLLEVDPLHGGCGVYFGIEADPASSKAWVVARNETAEVVVLNHGMPTNNLLEYSLHGPPYTPDLMWRDDSFYNLHQILLHHGLIWVVNGAAPELVAVDPVTRRRVGQWPLADWVPDDLQHPAPERHPKDRFHFNSLLAAGDKLVVLAHNWYWGSFALAVSVSDLLTCGNQRPPLSVTRGLGASAHDLWLDAEGLWTLSSDSGELVCSSGRTVRLPDAGPDGRFLRGTCQLPGGAHAHRLVFGGARSLNRGHRSQGETYVYALDAAYEVLSVTCLGAHGNSCCARVMATSPIPRAQHLSSRSMASA